jgi:DNA-directed RNA polymerase specialized sigma24 family protein
VTSEVFLKVAGGIRDFPGTSAEDFRRWLFRIATNAINAHLRQSIRRRELLEAAVQMGTINPAVISGASDVSRRMRPTLYGLV